MASSGTNSSAPERVVIACHDAGGAAVVAAWARCRLLAAPTLVLDGPAIAIFAARLPTLTPMPPDALERAVAQADFVLTGSSWGAELEKRAIRLARQAGRPCATFLDHWTDYRERFELDGAQVLPDEIWVGDEPALALARAAFPEAAVRLQPNDYLAGLVRGVLEASGPPRGYAPERVLYVCEPTSVAAAKKFGDARHLGYTEFEALEGYFLHALAQPRLPERIRVRPHPSEPPDKYDGLLASYADRLPVELSAGRDLAAELAWAEHVVGCESMALVIAEGAGKRVTSCIPAGGRPLSLPLPGIVRLFGA